jgi:hypothetical protein
LKRFGIRRQIFAVGIMLAVAAIAGAVVRKPSGPRGPDSWDILRHNLVQRAEVDLFEDFRTGLDNWESSENLAATWGYDSNSYVMPGTLALLGPSKPLTDYEVDAVVQVESKALGITIRAANLRNYQALRLVEEGVGSVPVLIVERYTVVGGQESSRVRVPYPARHQKESLYRVHVVARGENFSLYIQGHLVDAWTERRLKSGGVGFFCTNGEQARIAWLRIHHNVDTAGKLCAFVTSVL